VKPGKFCTLFLPKRHLKGMCATTGTFNLVFMHKFYYPNAALSLKYPNVY